MIVRLCTGRAGLTGSNAPGDVIDVPDAEARRLLASGGAEPVTVEIEAAVDTPAETAALSPAPEKQGTRRSGRRRGSQRRKSE